MPWRVPRKHRSEAATRLQRRTQNAATENVVLTGDRRDDVPVGRVLTKDPEQPHHRRHDKVGPTCVVGRWSILRMWECCKFQMQTSLLPSVCCAFLGCQLEKAVDEPNLSKKIISATR